MYGPLRCLLGGVNLGQDLDRFATQLDGRRRSLLWITSLGHGVRQRGRKRPRHGTGIVDLIVGAVRRSIWERD